MGSTAQEKARYVLTAIKNGVKYDFAGNFSSSIEWYNLEDVLRTLRKVVGQGIDKSELRTILNNLTSRDLLEQREAKDKTQSKAEYRISEKGKKLLLEWQKIELNLEDINVKNV